MIGSPNTSPPRHLATRSDIMSYYHPSLARHQPTMTAEMVPTQSIHAPHQLDHDVSIPGQPRVASVKGALAAELAATLVSPSATSAPLAMPARSGGGRPAAAGGAGVGAKKNKNLNKVPQRLNAAQQLMWADHLVSSASFPLICHLQTSTLPPHFHPIWMHFPNNALSMTPVYFSCLACVI